MINCRDTVDFGTWRVNCKYCDAQTQQKAPSTVSPKFETLLSSFFQLLNSTSDQVRLNMSKNMIKLSNHVKCFNSNSLAQHWMSYVEDTNDEIRKNFGKAIGPILTNRINASLSNKSLQDDIPPALTEFVNMIMNKLVFVLNEALTTHNHSLQLSLLFTAKSAAW